VTSRKTRVLIWVGPYQPLAPDSGFTFVSPSRLPCASHEKPT
jgi:hypothetical protein